MCVDVVCLCVWSSCVCVCVWMVCVCGVGVVVVLNHWVCLVISTYNQNPALEEITMNEPILKEDLRRLNHQIR